MTNPLISIGLPVVKSDFLIKSIDSCLKQSYNNIEIIIQNNAKDQNIKDEINRIVSTYSDIRIKYFETEKQLPMVQNWNATLYKANGEYFCILCDDDFWEPTFLEEIIKLSRKFEMIYLFHSRVAVVNENEKILSLSNSSPFLEDGVDFLYHRLNGTRMTYLSDFVVKTIALKQIGGFIDFPDGWGSDTFTWFKIALTSGVASTPKILFNYRVSQINVSNSKNIKNKLLAIDMHHHILKEMLLTINFGNEKYSEVRKEILVREIDKYVEKNKKYIFFNVLIYKYRLSVNVAHLISFAYINILKFKNKFNFSI